MPYFLVPLIASVAQRFSLMRRRFSPLEDRLIAAVRAVLPPQAQTIFDAQVSRITLVQRLPPHWAEISFYRRRHGKVDWSDIPAFPRTGEFRLASDFLARDRSLAGDWTFHDSGTAYSTAFADGEFLVLAERGGDQFILHRIELLGSSLFYLDSHDGTPEPVKGDILDVFRQPDSRNA